jgi:uncharacterized membrane protein YgdD (TMEM256/DUF423 family)
VPLASLAIVAMSTFFVLAALSGAVAVALGAFAAHGLRRRLAAERLATLETGVRYQFYHVAGLLAAGWMTAQWPQNRLAWAAGWLFVLGTLLFAGALYGLALSGRRGFGAVAPFGGVAFIAGWLCLALAAWGI